MLGVVPTQSGDIRIKLGRNYGAICTTWRVELTSEIFAGNGGFWVAYANYIY